MDNWDRRVVVSAGIQQRSSRSMQWRDWDEWEFVRHALQSVEPHTRSRAVALINVWRARAPSHSRLGIPAAVDASAVLCDWLDRVSVAAREDLYALRLEGAMAIVRLVNAAADPLQKSTNAQSIALLLRETGLDPLFVDIRHSAAHNELPGLPILKVAAKRALEWLDEQYWTPQMAKIDEMKRNFAQLFGFYRENGQVVKTPKGEFTRIKGVNVFLQEKLKAHKIGEEEISGNFFTCAILNELKKEQVEMQDGEVVFKWRPIVEECAKSSQKFLVRFVIELLCNTVELRVPICCGLFECGWNALTDQVSKNLVAYWILYSEHPSLQNSSDLRQSLGKISEFSVYSINYEKRLLNESNLSSAECGFKEFVPGLPLGTVYYDPLAKQSLVLDKSQVEVLDGEFLRSQPPYSIHVKRFSDVPKESPESAGIVDSQIKQIEDDIEIFI
jgi:hypothetical protein